MSDDYVFKNYLERVTGKHEFVQVVDRTGESGVIVSLAIDTRYHCRSEHNVAILFY